MRSTNPLGNRQPQALDWDRLHALSGRISALAFCRCPIDFDKLGEVDTARQGFFYGSDIRSPAVSCQLKLPGCCPVELLNKCESIFTSALAKVPSKNQFRGALDSDERPGVAMVRALCPLFLAVDETLNFVGLNVVNVQIDDHCFEQFFTTTPGKL